MKLTDIAGKYLGFLRRPGGTLVRCQQMTDTMLTQQNIGQATVWEWFLRERRMMSRHVVVADPSLAN